MLSLRGANEGCDGEGAGEAEEDEKVEDIPATVAPAAPSAASLPPRLFLTQRLSSSAVSVGSAPFAAKRGSVAAKNECTNAGRAAEETELAAVEGTKRPSKLLKGGTSGKVAGADRRAEVAGSKWCELPRCNRLLLLEEPTFRGALEAGPCDGILLRRG